MDNFQRNSAGRFPYFLCELGEKTELIGRHIERRGEQKMTKQSKIHPFKGGLLHSLGSWRTRAQMDAGITGKERFRLKKSTAAFYDGQWRCGRDRQSQEVTHSAENFCQEKATAAILCRSAHADLFPIDIGMARDTKVPAV